MKNYYKDSPEIASRMDNPLMRRIVELKGGDYEDFMDNYSRILDLAGEVAAGTVAGNAAAADREGPSLKDGRVSLSEATAHSLKVLRQAGLYGISLPVKYGGLDLPFTVFCAISEMVSRADASMQNVWGLQSCADTILEFGSGEQKEKYLPMVCRGASMSMDLTEPDAGSDLQSAMLRATEDAENGCWRLNGVKRFITNGDADIHLILARSEEGTRDGRGLSLFIYDRRDGGMEVRRLEDKMGIHGSPTCELVFRNARAELCGVRRMGLIKYVMSLMNGARLGVASQSVGIADAAWREAASFAAGRRQFGQPVAQFPPVKEMLAMMKARVEASRSLLYETARYVDIYKSLEMISRERPLSPEEKAECKRYSRLADALTPLAKGMSSEFANLNAYDCVQVHGGSGYMRDYTCERLMRDARVTSLYEGTTQMQVVAAMRHIMGGTYSQLAGDMLAEAADSTFKSRLLHIRTLLDGTVSMLTGAKQPELNDLFARRLMEMSSFLLMGTLLLRDTAGRDDAAGTLQTFTAWADGTATGYHSFMNAYGQDA